MSVIKWERGKRPRRESSDELYVEELSPDDIGYDADAEVLRPDQYEEIDSDFEDDKTLPNRWPSTDEELARKLGLLACDPEPTESSHPDENEAGRKRRSKEMENETPPTREAHADFEVTEMVDGQAEQRPTKKRRKRPSQHGIAYRLGRKHVNGIWSDSSDRTDDREMPLIESSCSGTPEVTPTPEAELEGAQSDDDAMDVG